MSTASAIGCQRSSTVLGASFLRKGLELGESHLDRVEVGAVGGQEAQLGADALRRPRARRPACGLAGCP